MIGDPFKIPGEEVLRQMAGPKAPAGDTVFAKARQRGGTIARPKPQAKADAAGKEEATEPIQEYEKQKASGVLLSNGRWLRPQGKYGQSIEASVDVLLPADLSHLTRVVFTLYELLPDGKRVERLKDEKTHAKDGKAVCTLTLPEPQTVEGQVPEKAYFQFVAKHAKSEEHQGPRIEAVPGAPATAFESVLYYSPLRGEYLHLETQEEFDSLQEEFEKLTGLQGKTREALEADEKVRQKKLEAIAKEAEQLFEGEAIGDADGVFEELVLVRQNPRWGKAKSWIYIRSHARKNKTQVRGHFRKETDKIIQENLDDLLKKAPGNKEASPLLSGDVALKLFEHKPTPGQPLKWYRKEKYGEIAGKAFHFTKEAAVVRFAYGFEGEATTNWKEKKIRLGGSGHWTFGLLEGSMTGKIPCPEKGINLLECLHEVKGIREFIKQGRHCLFRVNVTLGVKGFVGLSVQGALSLPHIDLSKEKPGKKKDRKVEAGGTASGVAGIQGSESLAITPQWSPTNSPPDFKDLGFAQVEIGATVGAAGEARVEVTYNNGKFKFKVGAGVALGIGPRGGIAFEVDVQEGWRLVAHLLDCVDYHYVVDISKEAFEAYKNYTFTLMTKGKQALLSGVIRTTDVIDRFRPWFEGLQERLGDIKKSLWETSTYDLALANVPPEALGQALITLMKTREEEDFQPLFWILRSTVIGRRGNSPNTSANHKLKWTLRSVSDVDIPDDEKDPTYESKKAEALQSGIQRIKDFGAGIGYVDNQGHPQERNADFLRKFLDLLHDNGVR